MPNERVSMSKLKQLIGLQASNLSVRALARALGLSVGAVSKYLRAVRGCGISAAEAETLAEHELERRVFGAAAAPKAGALVPPDCAWIHGELKRHRHVTLQLLWEEYRERYGEAAYRRSAFCQIYRRWEKRLKRSMRQRHFAGEKLFVDYAGRTVPIYGGARAGGVRRAAVRECAGRQWLRVRGGDAHPGAAGLARESCAGAGVLRRGADDLRSGQPQGRRHARRSLRARAAALVRGTRGPLPGGDHPGATVPAEGQKPRGTDGFAGVSLDPGAPAASALLQLGGAERGDPPAARRAQRASLPAPAGLAAQCLRGARPAGDAAAASEPVRVRRVEGAHRRLRLPRRCRSPLLQRAARARRATRCGRATRRPPWRSSSAAQRVATHIRSYQRGAHTTVPEHMPKSHRAHAEWSPKRLIQWGESIGAHTGAIVEHLLRSKPHPEQGYRACLGLLALARQYGEGRLEAASALAVRLGSPTRKSVKSILESGRDRRPSSTSEPLALELPLHGNVRGPGYYH